MRDRNGRKFDEHYRSVDGRVYNIESQLNAVCRTHKQLEWVKYSVHKHEHKVNITALRRIELFLSGEDFKKRLRFSPQEKALYIDKYSLYPDARSYTGDKSNCFSIILEDFPEACIYADYEDILKAMDYDQVH